MSLLESAASLRPTKKVITTGLVTFCLLWADAPMPRIEVLTAVAPTALPLSWRTNTPGAWLAMAASLARNVPAYRLPVSWELGALAAAVRGIVLDAAPPQDAARAAAS